LIYYGKTNTFRPALPTIATQYAPIIDLLWEN